MSFSLRLPVSTSHAWSFADQAMVSGSNFLCGILLARSLGIEAFGIYVVAQTYLLYANTFQGALVVSPMMTLVPAEAAMEKRREMLRGFFGYTCLVLAATISGVEGLAWVLGHWYPAISLGSVGIPLAAAMAAYQIQDWLRRACYTESANRRVFFGDVVAYGGQLSLLGILGIFDELTPATALWAMALSFSASIVATAIASRLLPSIRQGMRIIREHLNTSGNFLASWQLQWLGSQGVILFGTAMVGPQAAGAIRAAQNLLGPFNVLFQWMDNVIPVRAAIKLRESGRGALGAYLWKIGGLGIAALAGFTLILTIVDEPLIVLLYGEQYRPFAILVVLQALYYLFGHAYRTAAYYQRALGEIRSLAIASAWWAAIALATAFLFVDNHADRGIMIALVVGEISALLYLLTRHQAGAKSATHCVLRRQDGSIHLLLPIRNFRLLARSLRLYFPSRLAGKIYRWFLLCSLPLRGKIRAIETLGDLKEHYPHLEANLANTGYGATLENCAILVGSPGPREKLTVQVMDSRATVLAYIRMAYSEEAIAIVRHEADVLQHLRSLVPIGSAPEISAIVENTEPNAICVVEKAGPALSLPQRLTKDHFSYLQTLVSTRLLVWPEIVDRLAIPLRRCAQEFDATDLVNRALSRLAGAFPVGIPQCIEHGDFAPWNIRRDDIGQLFILDWEHARFEGIPWADALHFICQVESLVHRRPAELIVQRMLNVFSDDAALGYADRIELSFIQQRALLIYYLCRAIVDCWEERAICDRLRLAMLQTLVQHEDANASERLSAQSHAPGQTDAVPGPLNTNGSPQ